MVFEEPIDTVSARLVVGERPGLIIEDGPPAPPPGDSLRLLLGLWFTSRNPIVSQTGRSPDRRSLGRLDNRAGVAAMTFDNPRYWQLWTDATSTEQTLELLVRRKHREEFKHQTCKRAECPDHPDPESQYPTNNHDQRTRP